MGRTRTRTRSNKRSSGSVEDNIEENDGVVYEECKVVLENTPPSKCMAKTTPKRGKGKGVGKNTKYSKEKDVSSEGKGKRCPLPNSRNSGRGRRKASLGKKYVDSSSSEGSVSDYDPGNDHDDAVISSGSEGEGEGDANSEDMVEEEESSNKKKTKQVRKAKPKDAVKKKSTLEKAEEMIACPKGSFSSISDLSIAPASFDNLPDKANLSESESSDSEIELRISKVTPKKRQPNNTAPSIKADSVNKPGNKGNKVSVNDLVSTVTPKEEVSATTIKTEEFAEDDFLFGTYTQPEVKNEMVKEEPKKKKQKTKFKEDQEAKGKASKAKKGKANARKPQRRQKKDGNNFDMKDLIDSEMKLHFQDQGIVFPSSSGLKLSQLDLEDMSDDSDNENWEDVDEAKIPETFSPKKANKSKKKGDAKDIQVSLQVSNKHMDRKKRREEKYRLYIERAIRRFQREVQVNVHKVHLLCLVASLRHLNQKCNSSIVKNACFDGTLERPMQACESRNVAFSPLLQKGQVLVSLLRALGLLVRLVLSLQPVSPKVESQTKGKKNSSKGQRKGRHNSKATPSFSKTKGKEGRGINITKSSNTVKKNKDKTAKQEQKSPYFPSTSRVKSDAITSPKSESPSKPKSTDKGKGKFSQRKSKGGGNLGKERGHETPKSSSNAGKELRQSKSAVKGGKELRENKSKKTCSPATTSTKSDARSRKRVQETDKLNLETPKSTGRSQNQRASKNEQKINSSKKKGQIKVANSSDRMTERKRKASQELSRGKKRPLRNLRGVRYADNKGDGISDGSESSSDEYEPETMEDDEDLDDFEESLIYRSPNSEYDKPLNKLQQMEKDYKDRVNKKLLDTISDDQAFEESSKPLRSPESISRQNSQVISSDTSDDDCGNQSGIDVWVEVFLQAEDKWICVELYSWSLNRPETCERLASQPVQYILGIDNDGAIKDVTCRYASNWLSKTRKQRVDRDWWSDTLTPYQSKDISLSKKEDKILTSSLSKQPMPNKVSDFKDHPLYALRRHLLKFEAIYPEKAAPLGYIRNEAIYSRDCVCVLHSRESWIKEARVVRKGEKPYKIVKGRPRKNTPTHERDNIKLEVFGFWQTEEYKPPPAKNGKVPRNEYGNVELFKPCMLPPGTVHLPIQGILKVAKKLNIDAAPAMVGWEAHCGYSVPMFEGVVVCKEFEDKLLDGWNRMEEEAEKKRKEKIEKRVYDRWKLLIRGLLVRERLKRKYTFSEADDDDSTEPEPKRTKEDDDYTNLSVSWPQNRKEGTTALDSEGHCHIFPKANHKQDPLTGFWTKSCSCGLTLPLEK